MVGTPSSRRIGRHVAHGRVEALGEAEADAGFGHAARHTHGADLDGHPQRLQDVGRPDRRRGRTPPVLADRHPAPGDHQRGQGGHIDTAQAVTAGPHQIDHRIGADGQVEGHGGLHHGPRQPGHLFGGLALGMQEGEEGADLGRRGLAGQHRAQRGLGLFQRERLPGGQAAQDIGPPERQSHHRSRSRTPRAIRPSWTCEVPSTMVSCLASRYHCSVG